MNLNPLIEPGWVNAILPELILSVSGMLLILFAAFAPKLKEATAPLALVGFIVTPRRTAERSSIASSEVSFRA